MPKKACTVPPGLGSRNDSGQALGLDVRPMGLEIEGLAEIQKEDENRLSMRGDADAGSTGRSGFSSIAFVELFDVAWWHPSPPTTDFRPAENLIHAESQAGPRSPRAEGLAPENKNTGFDGGWISVCGSHVPWHPCLGHAPHLGGRRWRWQRTVQPHCVVPYLSRALSSRHNLCRLHLRVQGNAGGNERSLRP